MSALNVDSEFCRMYLSEFQNFKSIGCKQIHYVVLYLENSRNFFFSSVRKQFLLRVGIKSGNSYLYLLCQIFLTQVLK